MSISSKFKAPVIAALLLGTVAAVPPARAAAATPDSIVNMLSNMGYSAKLDGRTAIFSNGSHTINMTPADDGSIVYAQVYYAVPPDKASKMPVLKMLAFNDTHRVYTFVTLNAQGAPIWVGVDVQVGSKNLSPIDMRDAIDSINNTATEQQAMVNPANW